MNTKTYIALKNELLHRGYEDEYFLVKSQLNDSCKNPVEFFNQYVWVVLNSGIKNQVATVIYKRVMNAIYEGNEIESVFKHEKKVGAIKYLLDKFLILFYAYSISTEKLDFFESLPFIGKITKYHLARNLGIDVVKPDRHLVRIAKMYETDPYTLCQKISKECGDRVGIVDLILWRAGNLGIV